MAKSRIYGKWMVTTRYYDDGKVFSKKAVVVPTQGRIENPWDSTSHSDYVEYHDYFGSERYAAEFQNDLRIEYKNNYRFVNDFADALAC